VSLFFVCVCVVVGGGGGAPREGGFRGEQALDNTTPTHLLARFHERRVRQRCCDGDVAPWGILRVVSIARPEMKLHLVLVPVLVSHVRVRFRAPVSHM
jgi:hypothetical protein